MVQGITHVQTMDLIGLETDSELAVATTAVVYTQSFQWPRGSAFSVEYRFESDGTVELNIEIESGAVEPTTEGAADTDNYGVGNSIETAIGDEVTHWKAPSPTVSKFCRFKITGTGSNAASTKLVKLRLHYVSLD